MNRAEEITSAIAHLDAAGISVDLQGFIRLACEKEIQVMEFQLEILRKTSYACSRDGNRKYAC